jgi:hypothetical protein
MTTGRGPRGVRRDAEHADSTDSDRTRITRLAVYNRTQIAPERGGANTGDTTALRGTIG